MERVRWRLNDPGEETRVRWTKVHVVESHDRTACRIKIPQWPYDRDTNEQIPDDADACQRCQKATAT